MLVPVTWGSKLGGTQGIARIIADTLEQRGFEVTTEPAETITGIRAFDAVMIGGALYANRWPGKLRRFMNRIMAQLRKVPVWFFSSGPLDNSAEKRDIPPPNQIAVLADRVGVKRHVTCGSNGQEVQRRLAQPGTYSRLGQRARKRAACCRARKVRGTCFPLLHSIVWLRRLGVGDCSDDCGCYPALEWLWRCAGGARDRYADHLHLSRAAVNPLSGLPRTPADRCNLDAADSRIGPQHRGPLHRAWSALPIEHTRRLVAIAGSLSGHLVHGFPRLQDAMAKARRIHGAGRPAARWQTPRDIRPEHLKTEPLKRQARAIQWTPSGQFAADCSAALP